MKMGRPRKLTPLQEIAVYENIISNKASIAEMAYKNGVSSETIRRIVQEQKKLRGVNK